MTKFAFDPPRSDERVKHPALKFKSGEVVEGPLHYEALDIATAKGIKGPFSEGFTTTKGRYIGREEALKMARYHNQTKSEVRRQYLDALDLPETSSRLAEYTASRNK